MLYIETIDFLSSLLVRLILSREVASHYSRPEGQTCPNGLYPYRHGQSFSIKDESSPPSLKTYDENLDENLAFLDLTRATATCY